MRVSWSWKNWSPTFHAARGTFISEVWQLSAEVWGLSSQGRASSQTKEMKVPLKAWKVGLKVFNSWKHSNDALGILLFWGRGLYLRLDLDLSLWSELQHCKSSLKVSMSSTENSRLKACYFPKSEARGQNWPLRLPSYTTSIKTH